MKADGRPDFKAVTTAAAGIEVACQPTPWTDVGVPVVGYIIEGRIGIYPSRTCEGWKPMFETCLNFLYEIFVCSFLVIVWVDVDVLLRETAANYKAALAQWS